MKKGLFILITAFAFHQANSQSIGIGTTSPNASAQLDVSSTSKGMLIPRMTSAQRSLIATPANGLLVYETTTNSFWFYNGTAWSQLGTGGASLWSVSGTNIYNGNTGSVGIGTTTPSISSILDVKSTTKGVLLPSMTQDQRMAIPNPAQGLLLYQNNEEDGFFFNSSLIPTIPVWRRISEGKNVWVTAPGSGDNIRNSNADKVGIGTTAEPTEKLDVNGNIRTRDDLLADGRVVATGIVSGSSLQTPGNLAVSGIGYINGNITTNQNLSVGGTSLLQEAVNGNSTARFSGDIESETSFTIDNPTGILTFKSGSDDKAFAQLSGDDFRVGTFSSNASGGFIVRTGGFNRMIVNNLGNVGIGTTSPGSTLHVQGRGLFRGSGEVITVDGTSNPNIGFYYNSGFRSFISQTPTNLVIGVNNGALQLDATQIAIGAVVAAASGYKLTVTGKVICEELKVQLQGAWPDYVFRKEYNLMPIEELRDFIKINNHLPNIPAAAAMEKSGMEVGEMQRKMMEKIEELTLYIIQLEEKLNAISKK